MDKLNIICLLWKGSFRGRDYEDKDVVRLLETVNKWANRDFDFYCLTNDMDSEIPAQKIKLVNNWPGWWSKVELFRPDLPCGRTLYLDLDTHIVNNMQPLLNTKGDLVMFPSPYGQGYQAGTMLFTPAAKSWVYDTFRANPLKYIAKYRSEQDMYWDWMPDLETFPAKWMQKISILKNKKMKDETIIVTGRPKKDDWRNPSFAEYLERRAR